MVDVVVPPPPPHGQCPIMAVPVDPQAQLGPSVEANLGLHHVTSFPAPLMEMHVGMCPPVHLVVPHPLVQPPPPPFPPPMPLHMVHYESRASLRSAIVPSQPPPPPHSPSGEPPDAFFHQVQSKALEREEARKKGDYERGDKLRNELTSMGVQVFDKTHVFVLPDGTQGSYSLTGRSNDGAPPLLAQPAEPASCQAHADLFAHVQRMCIEREKARKSGDYATSDSMRSKLEDMGVRVEDKSHTFCLPNGSIGSYDLNAVQQIPPPPPTAPPPLVFAPPPPPSSALPSLLAPVVAGGSFGGTINFADVQKRCVAREEARKIDDFRTADEIRTELGLLGITLDDKSHTFTMPDGTRGSYSLIVVNTPEGSAPLPPVVPPAPVVPVVPSTSMVPTLGMPLVVSPGLHVAVPFGQPPPPPLPIGGFPPPPALGVYPHQDPAHAAAIYQHMVAQQAAAAAMAQPLQQAAVAHHHAYAVYYQQLLGYQASPVHGQMLGQTLASGAEPGAAQTVGGVAAPQSITAESVRAYCLQREEVRKSGDYKLADHMRDQLAAVGVRVEDKMHTFCMPDGTKGSYDLTPVDPPPPVGTTFESVREYCLRREEIRKGGDYKTADSMRHKLTAIGVKVEDKSHMFFMPGGTVGYYDLNAGDMSEPEEKRQRLE
eukprot:TRINITY_DN21394_c0_g1_i1.p1 TRINITY_DN21394_c0_g1~~TRINITY_DN21394_c0_g1_i1.p1  ORF type:complete len:657 (-),score=113.20 TRINITY_DN21394_c0_g1_i1:130-2100(-)